MNNIPRSPKKRTNYHPSRTEKEVVEALLELSREYIKKIRNLTNIYANDRSRCPCPPNGSEAFTDMTKDLLLHRIKSKLMRMKVTDVKRIYRSIAQS
jgi:hypothetical protein